MKSVADLNQIQRATRPSDILEFIPVSASRAQEVDTKVIDCGFAFIEAKLDRAAFAGPHGHLLTVRGGIVA